MCRAASSPGDGRTCPRRHTAGTRWHRRPDAPRTAPNRPMRCEPVGQPPVADRPPDADATAAPAEVTGTRGTPNHRQGSGAPLPRPDTNGPGSTGAVRPGNEPEDGHRAARHPERVCPPWPVATRCTPWLVTITRHYPPRASGTEPPVTARGLEPDRQRVGPCVRRRRVTGPVPPFAHRSRRCPSVRSDTIARPGPAPVRAHCPTTPVLLVSGAGWVRPRSGRIVGHRAADRAFVPARCSGAEDKHPLGPVPRARRASTAVGDRSGRPSRPNAPHFLTPANTGTSFEPGAFGARFSRLCGDPGSLRRIGRFRCGRSMSSHGPVPVGQRVPNRPDPTRHRSTVLLVDALTHPGPHQRRRRSTRRTT